MSLSNLLTKNNYNLYSSTITVGDLTITGEAINSATNFYSTTSVSNMKINHFNGSVSQSDNLGAVHFTRIGKVVYCRLPIFTTASVVSGLSEGNYLYVWPLPAGYFNAAGVESDLGLQFIEVPDDNQGEVTVDFRIEPNINNASSGVVNQPGIAIRTAYNDNDDSPVHWPATTHFSIGKPVTFSYLID